MPLAPLGFTMRIGTPFSARSLAAFLESRGCCGWVPLSGASLRFFHRLEPWAFRLGPVFSRLRVLLRLLGPWFPFWNYWLPTEPRCFPLVPLFSPLGQISYLTPLSVPLESLFDRVGPFTDRLCLPCRFVVVSCCSSFWKCSAGRRSLAGSAMLVG